MSLNRTTSSISHGSMSLLLLLYFSLPHQILCNPRAKQAELLPGLSIQFSRALPCNAIQLPHPRRGRVTRVEIISLSLGPRAYPALPANILFSSTMWKRCRVERRIPRYRATCLQARINLGWSLQNGMYPRTSTVDMNGMRGRYLRYQVSRNSNAL
jgi:hypothetical protein